NAFTDQLMTVYQFNTAGGPEAFYQLLEKHLDALLKPDYTDEEIRREVRNFGVATGPDGKTLMLEEKGTVYNEMSSSSRNPAFIIERELSTELFGPNHPLSYSSGGLPSGIRELRPEHIRSFHDANYHLWNMGMVCALPREMSLAGVLARLNRSLTAAEPGALKGKS